MKPLVPVLVGPTAVGKTALSLVLAEHLNAEIVSADSRQIYRELTIGTAKPAPDELAQVPHHFINELSLDTPFSAGRFQEAATRRIHDILNRDRMPMVVGGSTLYLHALCEGLADIPPVSPEIRPRLMHRLETEGADRLYAELLKFDPDFARSLDPTKTQRLVRGLEVYLGTGRPLSSFYHSKPEIPFNFVTFVLNRDRERLYRRIERRVDAMLEAGLLEEVEHLLEAGYSPDLNPLRTIGYQEPIAFLKGEIDEAEMIRLLKRNSRRYAKRQLTWFRRYESYIWIDLKAYANLDEAVADLVRLFRAGNLPEQIASPSLRSRSQ